MEAIVKKYDAKLDNKKRLTIRGTKYNFYHIQEFNDGTLVLKPRILVDPNEVSKNTLNMMDKSIDNLKKGNISKPIDIDKYLKIVEETNKI
ncbi:conserved hypothetical protein [Candidatus Magnetomoraceae bacterium gMMP-15]